MPTEQEKRKLDADMTIIQAEIRALQALRTALMVLHDAQGSFAIVASDDPRNSEEIQAACARAFDVLAPLVHAGSQAVGRLCRHPMLAEADLAAAIKDCNGILEIADAERSWLLGSDVREKLKDAERKAQTKRQADTQAVEAHPGTTKVQ